jgi:transcriptional regulator with XRE-family HTH domain
MSSHFGEYLKEQIATRRKSEGRVWTQNELGRRAGISGGHVSMLINGKIAADPPTLLPPPEGELSGDVLALAREVEALPAAARPLAIQAIRGVLHAMYAMAGESITAGYSVLDEGEYLAAIIRQFRDADPEGYAEFVATLSGDDRTPAASDTSGGAGQDHE